jgi:hypothetical protein
MTLTTEEMTLLARLLGNHVVGNGELTTLGMKLLDWAGIEAGPLDLELGYSGHSHLTFRHKDRANG